MSELAKRVLDSIEEAKPARDLQWSDRGRLAAVETPAALFVGTLGSIIFHAHGDVTLYFERDGFKTDVMLGPDVTVWFAPQPTEQES